MDKEFKTNHHVTPWKGWCNDLNGLLFDGEYYHVFYQHYPDDTKWGPMHWGHSISKDLYNWEHLPIALFPNSKEYCFSGSAIIDESNISGLGEGNEKPILLFYTSHCLPSDDTSEYIEEQSIAYSLDGIHFKKYEGNPILANQGTPNFRDPKVFVLNGQWCMALAVFDHIEFYQSNNLLDWEFLSSFAGDNNNSIEGIWECPSVFEVMFEGRNYWILIVSMGADQKDGRAITQYFIGDFIDGKFIVSETVGHSRLIDYGTDNYAAVDFSGTENPLLMGWALNWGYANNLPYKHSVGQMTSPRTPFLYRDVKKKLSLGSKLKISDNLLSKNETISWPTDKELLLKNLFYSNLHLHQQMHLNLYYAMTSIKKY